MGVHQKIDRAVYRHIKNRLPKRQFFPTLHDVLHFEGTNGPDGIKRKSPAKDEPWHYIDPDSLDDTQLIVMINDHIHNMTEALKAKDEHRAAFEAAWMAHAIVDGLTPAHHYPLDEKIEELWGKPKEERLTIRDKNIIRGKTRRDTLSKNWEYWGAHGVFTNHFMFEWGVATTIAPLRFDDAVPTDEEYARMEHEPFEQYFLEVLREVSNMKMYEEFTRMGWSRHLAVETRTTLMPAIIKTVMLAWYQAVVRSR
jgi:hypothetical protein